MSTGEYDDYGRGYDAGREAAADEVERLRAAFLAACPIMVHAAQHARDEDWVMEQSREWLTRYFPAVQ